MFGRSMNGLDHTTTDGHSSAQFPRASLSSTGEASLFSEDKQTLL
jgi:hypothetical protein